MTKKVLAEQTADATGYSFSYCYKVLCGTLYNKEIKEVADKLSRNEPAYSKVKTKKNIPTTPTHNVFRKVRETKGYTVEQLAVKLGVFAYEVENIESNRGEFNPQVLCDWFEKCNVIISIKL